MKKLTMDKTTRHRLFLTGILVVAGFSALSIYNWWRFASLDLDTVPSSVTIDDQSVSLDFSINRNLGWYDDPSLLCVLTLSSNITSDIFSKLQVHEIWVWNVWETWHLTSWDIFLIKFSPAQVDYEITNITLAIVLRDGPVNDHWEFGNTVDVVVNVRYRLKSYFLLRQNVWITYSH